MISAYIRDRAALLVRPHFLMLFAAPNLLFWAAERTIGSGSLINILNAALIGVSVGVVVAYHEPVFKVLFGRAPLVGSDWLALGIFQSWLGSLVLRCGSLVWRAAGRPDSWEINPSISYGLFLYFTAGVCHLAAKGAMDNGGPVPTERWIKIGALTGASISALLLTGYLANLLRIDLRF